MRVITISFLAMTLLCVPAIAFCSPEVEALQQRIKSLEESLQKAHAGQGPLCTPQPLAAAQTCLAGVKEEYAEGDYWEAEDRLEECERQAEGIWNDILACAEDADADRIPNRLDRCPQEPESYNGYRDDDGCPDRMPDLALLAGDRIEILEPFGFDQDNRPAPPAARVLKEIARILQENQQVKLRIDVHLDDSYPPADAIRVSTLRAENVRNSLIALGVAANRLEAIGKGSQEPIAPNSSDLGRQLNQRVEFIQIHEQTTP